MITFVPLKKCGGVTKMARQKPNQLTNSQIALVQALWQATTYYRAHFDSGIPFDIGERIWVKGSRLNVLIGGQWSSWRKSKLMELEKMGYVEARKLYRHNVGSWFFALTPLGENSINEALRFAIKEAYSSSEHQPLPFVDSPELEEQYDRESA
jgi:hypothetical protein